MTTEDSTIEAVARKILSIDADRAGLVRAADAYLMSLKYGQDRRREMLARLGVTGSEVWVAWEVVRVVRQPTIRDP